MPRSSDEMETRTGRRTPNPSGSSVHDAQPRRSTRYRPTVKNNESSPESPQSDNNTANPRVTRKRAGTMDSAVVSEKVRTLRPRKNSTSPTISEVTDVETTGTPSRRTRRSIAAVPSAETPKAVPRTRRLTRAGSEAKSPPRTPRTTRRTRASSMGPEAIIEIKEETKKVVKADQEHALPEITEVNEDGKIIMEVEMDEDKTTQPRESEGTKEEGEGQQSFKENVASAQNEKAKNDIIPSTKESELLNQPKLITTNEKSLPDTGTENVVIVDEESSQDGSKDFELQIENASHESTEEQHSDMSNKENETTHTINEMEQNADNVKTSITLQSPKPLRSVLTNKLGKEKPASPLRESVKNSEYTKDAAYANLDVSVTDVNATQKMEVAKSSVNETVVSHEVFENKDTQPSSEVSKSPLVIRNQSNEATPVKSSDLSMNNLEEKSGENSNDAQSAGDKTQREEAEKEIIDGIEITDITDSEIIQTEDPEVVETTGIVDDSETTTLDAAQDEATDEPMDVSILEFREIIAENTTSENKMRPEEVVEDKSVETVETSNTEAKSETVENVETPNKFKPTVLPSQNESNESETLENNDTTNSGIVATIEIADEKCHDVHTSDTIKDDTIANKDESNQSDAERTQTSVLPEPELESVVERNVTEEVPIESSPQNSPLAAGKPSNQTEPTKTDELSEKQDEEKKERTKNTVTSEIDSDANTECLFQDIPATEWKKKKKQSDSESISSLATEKIDNESEAECDLVLVDREAWLAAESYKAAKEKEMSDYDSDDTVVLKSRRDLVADRLNRSTKLQTLIEEDDDHTDEIVPKSVRRKSLSNRRKSVTKSAEKKVNMDESSQVKETVSSSDSPQRPASRTHLSRSLIMHETQETDDPSIKHVNLNKSDTLEMTSAKKRRLLNKSVHNISLQDIPGNKNKQDSEIDSDTIQLSSGKKTKCMNISQTNENSDDDLLESLADSKKKRKDRHSWNRSSKNKADLDESSSNKSCDESKESSEQEETNEIPSSLTKLNNKKKDHKKKVLAAVRVNSDSDETSAASDSDDANKTARVPRFLFAGAESDTDNMSDVDSIDSDIRREYNLDGKNISKFDDDDVAGDECRASESEYSDSNDNGSDLADFVVNDDEVEDDEDDDADEEEAEADDEGKEEVNVDVDENEVDVEVDDEEASDDVDRNDEGNALDVEELIEEIQNKEDTEDELEENYNSDSHEEKEELKADDSEDNDKGNDIDVQENKHEMQMESLQSSEIQKNKLEKAMDSALSDSIRTGKKKQEPQTSICIETEAEEAEVSKKEKKKKSNKAKQNTELDTSGQQHLEELCTRTMSLNKSLECSTPKHSVAKRDRFHTSLDTPNITLQTHKKANKISAASLLSSIFSKTDTKDIPLKTETPLRKLQKTKKIDKLLHKSLPAELIDLPKETNLSRVTSSNVSQLHKAVATPNPTQNECDSKEKLNVSNEIIKINKRSKKGKIATDDELSDNAIEPEEADVPDKIVPRVTNKNLKILAKAEALQKLQGQSKKLKKRKRDLKRAESEAPLAAETDESPTVISKKIKRVQDISNQDSEENVENISKKKKKKKLSSKVETEVVLHQVSNKIFAAPSTDAHQKVVDKPNKKKNKEKTKIISPDIENVSSTIMQNKKSKIGKTLPSESVASAEKLQKKQKLKEVSAKAKVPKKLQISTTSADSDDEPETISFSKAREDAMQAARLAAESLRVKKQMRQQRRDNHFEKTSSEKETKMQKKQLKSEATKSGALEVPKKGIKRLADDVLENLSDAPKAQAKKRKISKKEEQILPSKPISNPGFMESKVQVAETFIPLSSRGSTTQFSIINLQKLKRQTKKSAAVASFRQKMLGRNPRQPISAYMMYIEKQKARSNRQG